METHGFEIFPEGANGSSGEFMGGLFGDAEGCADFTVTLAVTDAYGDLAETRREATHRYFKAFAGFKSSGMID